MSLSIVAAKDMEQAIELLASRPRKAVKDHLAEEPEGVGNFLYDFRAAFTNYQCYHRFDPYGETCLEMDQVPAIKAFSDSVRKWLAGHSADETSDMACPFRKSEGSSRPSSAFVIPPWNMDMDWQVSEIEQG